MEKKFDIIEYLDNQKFSDENYKNHLEFFIKEDNKYEDKIKEIEFLEKEETNFGFIQYFKDNNNKKIFLDTKKSSADLPARYGLKVATEDIKWYIVEGMGYITYNYEKRPIIQGEMIEIKKGNLYDIEVDIIRRPFDSWSDILIIEESINKKNRVDIVAPNNAKITLTRDPSKVLNRMKVKWNDIFNKYHIPEELKESPINNLGLKYKDIIEPYYNSIKKMFDEADPRYVRSLESSTGEIYKLFLTNEGMEVIRPLVDFFRKEYNIEDDLDKVLSETSCVRNCKTTIPDIDATDFDEFYAKRDLPEWWHLDTTPEWMFRIGIYLTDVTEDTAPFVYLRNPENNYFSSDSEAKRGAIKLKSNNSPENMSYFKRYIEYGFMRYPFKDEDLVKLIAPAFTTFLFAPNFFHRATYAREKYRDVIYFMLFAKRKDN
jgi:mannose-6-phosphate isomerase-like protein (cupin superfamily)